MPGGVNSHLSVTGDHLRALAQQAWPSIPVNMVTASPVKLFMPKPLIIVTAFEFVHSDNKSHIFYTAISTSAVLSSVPTSVTLSFGIISD